MKIPQSIQMFKVLESVTVAFLMKKQKKFVFSNYDNSFFFFLLLFFFLSHSLFEKGNVRTVNGDTLKADQATVQLSQKVIVV